MMIIKLNGYNMRFNMLLILFLVSTFSIVKPMNFGGMNHSEVEEMDDEDLTFIERTKNKIKKHPVATGMYLLLVAGATGGSIFAYKKNPEEFWSALQGLKEALGDFWGNLRGKSALAKTENKKNEYNGPEDPIIPGIKEYPIVFNDEELLNSDSTDHVTLNQGHSKNFTSITDLLKDDKNRKQAKGILKLEFEAEICCVPLINKQINVLRDLYHKVYNENWDKVIFGEYNLYDSLTRELKTARELYEKGGSSNEVLKSTIKIGEYVQNAINNINTASKQEKKPNTAKNHTDLCGALINVGAVSPVFDGVDKEKIVGVSKLPVIEDTNTIMTISSPNRANVKIKAEEQKFSRHWQWRYIPIVIASAIGGALLRYKFGA